MPRDHEIMALFPPTLINKNSFKRKVFRKYFTDMVICILQKFFQSILKCIEIIFAFNIVCSPLPGAMHIKGQKGSKYTNAVYLRSGPYTICDFFYYLSAVNMRHQILNFFGLNRICIQLMASSPDPMPDFE